MLELEKLKILWVSKLKVSRIGENIISLQNFDKLNVTIKLCVIRWQLDPPCPLKLILRNHWKRSTPSYKHKFRLLSSVVLLYARSEERLSPPLKSPSLLFYCLLTHFMAHDWSNSSSLANYFSLVNIVPLFQSIKSLLSFASYIWLTIVE